MPVLVPCHEYVDDGDDVEEVKLSSLFPVLRNFQSELSCLNFSLSRLLLCCYYYSFFIFFHSPPTGCYGCILKYSSNLPSPFQVIPAHPICIYPMPLQLNILWYCRPICCTLLIIFVLDTLTYSRLLLIHNDIFFMISFNKDLPYFVSIRNRSSCPIDMIAKEGSFHPAYLPSKGCAASHPSLSPLNSTFYVSSPLPDALVVVVGPTSPSCLTDCQCSIRTYNYCDVNLSFWFPDLHP